MKSPFKKLRDLAVSKHGLKEQSPDALLELEEESPDVTRGMQEVEDMHLQYEGFVTNAQIISGAAFDFSRALQDMASYMIETFGQIIDGEIGNVFSMLAKVQFEVSKLLDLFAAHVSQTIIGPTETILKEIQQVQVMKEQYDEKRQSYNFLQKERLKGKSKNGKGSHFDQQSQSAKKNLKGQADILSFRLQSLKQGQSRSLITQAARYHSAQIHFFQKGLASVNTVEPVIRQLAMEKNIDRTFSESDVSVSGHMNELPVEVDSTRNYEESESMASSPTNFLDSQVEDGATSAQVEFAPKLEGTSKSAPLSPSMYYQKEPLSHFQDLSPENFKPKVSMYALPSPSDKSGNWASQTSKQNISTPLQPSKSHHYSGNTAETFNQDLGSHYIDTKRSGEHNDQGSGFQASQVMENQQSLKLPNKASTGIRQIGRTYSHSGPLMHNYSSAVNKHKPDSLSQVNQVSPIYNSGPVGRSSMPVYASNTSQTAPLSLLSPPQISELHKLPPPPSSSSAPPKPAGHVTYSAPLGSKAPEMPPSPGPASPLPPPPPGLVPRSLSIPSSADHKHAFHQGNTQETYHSPVLKPMTLPAATSVLH